MMIQTLSFTTPCPGVCHQLVWKSSCVLLVAMADTTMTLTIKTVQGDSFSVTVGSETTVIELKQRIEEEKKIPVDRQRLIFKGKVLKDQLTLTSYGECGASVLMKRSL